MGSRTDRFREYAADSRSWRRGTRHMTGGRNKFLHVGPGGISCACCFPRDGAKLFRAAKRAETRAAWSHELNAETNSRVEFVTTAHREGRTFTGCERLADDLALTVFERAQAAIDYGWTEHPFDREAREQREWDDRDTNHGKSLAELLNDALYDLTYSHGPRAVIDAERAVLQTRIDWLKSTP